MTTTIRSPFKAKPNTLYLHAKQLAVARSKKRFKVVVAGRRWGKTQLAKVMLMLFARGRKRLIWYVAPSYRMAKQIMWPELIEAIPKKWLKKDPNETTMTLVLKNGTRIELKGADNPDSLRGVGVHYLVMDEVQDIDPEAWRKVLRPTLASTGGHALFIGTPKAYNFLYELYMLGQRGEVYEDGKGRLRRNDWESWQFPTITSPFIPRSEIEAAMRDMDDKSFKQEFLASFETMSGRVYHAFERKVHVKPCPFNPKLPIWVGQDFNLDPMSSVILQPQPNGEVWCVGEISLPSSNTAEVGGAGGGRGGVVFFARPAPTRGWGRSRPRPGSGSGRTRSRSSPTPTAAPSSTPAARPTWTSSARRASRRSVTARRTRRSPTG
jgi:hypothetical protein